MLQNLLQGNLTKIFEYVQPHHYFGTLIQSILTLPFHLLMPTNEMSIFMGATIFHLIACFSILKTIQRHFSKNTFYLMAAGLIFAPIGIITATSSSDTAGNASLCLMLFLLIDCCFKNDDHKKTTLVALFSILIDVTFIPLAIYILFPHLKKIQQTLFKEKFSGFHVAILSIVIFEGFVVFKIIQKVFTLGESIKHYNLMWASQTFYQHFVADQSLLLQNLRPINLAAFFIFIYMLALTLIRKAYTAETKKLICISFYFFLYALLFYYLKTDEPYAKRPLAINSEYWQLWFYSSLILLIVNLNTIKNIKQSYYSYLLLLAFTLGYTVWSGRSLNNFMTYDLGFDRPYPRPKIDTIDNCINKMNDYNLSSTQQTAAHFGCNARELDPLTIKSMIGREGLFYYGRGLQSFYRNKNGVHFCNLLIEKEDISECLKGFEIQKML